MDEKVALNDGRFMPRIGLGLMRFGSIGETGVAIARGFLAGYRLFDTAAAYSNERQAGDAIQAAAIPRNELFVTTKLWNGDQGRLAVRSALERSLTLLRLDYLDLYLIHWPTPMYDLYVETWREFIKLRDEGLIRSIGVSNFNADHLGRLIDETGVVPAVNQIELHPRFQQPDLRAYHAAHGIITQAWSPFGGGGAGVTPILEEPILQAVADRHGCTAAQVIIAWQMAIDATVIPKATSERHLEENLAAVSIRLDKADMRAISGLHRPDGRAGPDPQVYTANQKLA